MALANGHLRPSKDTVSPSNISYGSSPAGDNANNRELEKSWYEITIEEEEEQTRLELAQHKHQEALEVSSQLSEPGSESTPQEELVMSSLCKVSNGRQIEIDILDSVNAEKYEKLVKSDLIKSPFKRRLSGNSSSDELDEGNPSGMDCNRSEESCANWKRSKKDDFDHGVGRLRRESSSSGTSSYTSRKQVEYETDEAVLARRQKQIDYGKNTLGYENYIRQVPKHSRTIEQPRTPQKQLKYSRRAWDGLVKIWRKKLHCYDPNSSKLEDDE